MISSDNFILTRTLSVPFCYSHLTSERVGDLPKVAQPDGSKDEI